MYVEIGIAYVLGKFAMGLKADTRGVFGGADDSMVLEVVDFPVVGSLWDVGGEMWLMLVQPANAWGSLSMRCRCCE